MAITDFYNSKEFFEIKGFTDNPTMWKWPWYNIVMFYIMWNAYLFKWDASKKFYETLCSLLLYENYQIKKES